MARKSCLFAMFLTAVVLSTIKVGWADETEVIFVSATECHGAHGVYRWDVKTDHEVPPDVIPEANRVKSSDIGGWAPPQGVITTHTPRSGREKEWYEISGRVTLLKAEPDGDLHIQLVDADGSSTINVVVEVPVKQHVGESPWDGVREVVFGWTKVRAMTESCG